MSRVAVIGIVGNSVFLPVENFHVGGETVEAISAHFEPGGKGFNAAVAAKRFGAQVSFLAALGSEGSEGIEAFLEKEGIDCTLVHKSGAGAFAAIITDKNGSNRVTVYQGVQLDCTDVDLFESEIASSDVLLLNNEVPENVNIKAVMIAKKHGVPVILNPAPARELNAYLLDNVTLFTPNEHEQIGLEDKGNVVTTLGKHGCYIRSLDVTFPAIDVAEVVDTTGAGDTFNGVLAAMMAQGNKLEYSVKMANLASSVEVTRKGAVTSIPTKDEVLAYVEKLT